MRLDKYLADMGIGTRSELKAKIRKGSVTIDGKTVKDPGYHVPDEAVIYFDGNPMIYESYVYYMLNKPAGVISATEDPKQETVIDLITEHTRSDLFPVGRLDKDTEGLLLITNDGALAHRLLSPKHHVDKVYFAIVKGIVSEQECNAFAKGLTVDETLTAMPADLIVLSIDPDKGTSEIEITIREGKFHQIKRMFETVGMKVMYLKRIRMGSLSLDPALSPGEYRRLTVDEIEALQSHETKGTH